MTTISIRELHEKTGRWVRQAALDGEIRVTDRGEFVAKLVAGSEPKSAPYFARRKILPGFKRLSTQGKLRGGADSTIGISEDRDDRSV